MRLKNVINKLKAKKSTGRDEIKTQLLKSLSHELSQPLSIIINKSLSEGIVPSDLKLAKVLPIFKSKDKEDFCNYRPISLLPAISKVLEKIVYKRTYNFLHDNNILYQSQYGFREKHSTIQAVSQSVFETLKALDEKKSVLGVYLDLSKAFDTINHLILIRKLEFYGIRGLPLEWFKDYLRNRKQYVQYQNHNSDRHILEFGVPQGSVLGPLLFLIYINDLPSCLEFATSINFADDTTLFGSHTDLKHLHSLMNQDLNNLDDWFRENKLLL